MRKGKLDNKNAKYTEVPGDDTATNLSPQRKDKTTDIQSYKKMSCD